MGAAVSPPLFFLHELNDQHLQSMTDRPQGEPKAAVVLPLPFPVKPDETSFHRSVNEMVNAIGISDLEALVKVVSPGENQLSVFSSLSEITGFPSLGLTVAGMTIIRFLNFYVIRFGMDENLIVFSPTITLHQPTSRICAMI
jgi:hypothetical protein